ncbi:hypothetical protein K469DRAFT_723890 [Zopfia rhizophila CBS 207.26]|uniref:DNA replication factor Cdt1 C-terminal domain-containing protein n=1 Tax=Zopfia rhizophila CBS 207.26 TaxID=1314779 RepID=A0A6A6D8F4_9PEZI|nr:hypothetical protein K469DRAFT_723890 [Zopfia rhizophila CBS 207.26]
MAARKVLTYGGLGAFGVGAYYLYNAGGSPKVAEKQFEHDAARASAKLKGELPGREKEAKTQGKVYGEQKYQLTKKRQLEDAKAATSKADARIQDFSRDASKKLEEYKKETGKELNNAVDKFDKTMSEGTSKSKSWIGSWFGGKHLLNLHSSFLTALSLHYAHNGTATPVDLRDLTQNISQVWQKRSVTIEDIRLCVGVLGSGPTGTSNPFYLSDYSHGKICLEIQEQHRMQGSLGALNENALQAMFMEGLEFLWKVWNETHEKKQHVAARPVAIPKRRGRPRRADARQTSIEPFVDENTLPKFLMQLPHAEITPCSSLAEVAPLREKGRKRLREFKDSVEKGRSKKARELTGKENEPMQQSEPAQAKITEFAQVRKSNLLDRILAKQAIAASLPTPPSPAELQRRAALQRSEEVLGVLELLAGNKGFAMGFSTRVSLSLTTVLQSLQGSVRSPISKEEAIKCVEVLASEVAPGYVSMMRMGAISSVVVNQAMRPVDLKGRLVSLGVE